MPSKSKSQHNLMAMVAHDPAAAKRLGIPQKVGKEFMDADKGRKFSKGDDMKKMKKMSGGGATAMGKVVAGGKRPHGEHTVQQKGHTKGKHVVMAGNKGMKKGGKAC
jgi:hypothetical protein